MKSQQSGLPNDRYWASVDSEELPSILTARAMAFRERLERGGRLDVWRRSERTYYGLDGEGGWANSVAVTYGGDEGELVLARVNHYRSIVQAVIAMVTSSRPAFTATAINTDVQSLTAAGLAKGVVEWAYRTKRLEDLRVEQVERAVVSGEGYLHLRWDIHVGQVVETKQRQVYDDKGEPVVDEVEVPVEIAPDPRAFIGAPPAPPSGLQEPPRTHVVQQPRVEPWPVREGDIAPEVLGPLQVVRDLDARAMRWALVPHRESVWDLAARYPQMRQHLIALRGHEQWARRVWGDDAVCKPDDDDDTIAVWCLYHLPCDALPKGRYALVAGDHVLVDEEWRFGDEIPVLDLVPMRQMDTESGYSPMWDLLCLQELYDATITAMASAHDSLGIQNIISPKGAEFSPEMIGRGLQLLEYEYQEGHPTGGKPEALQLLSIPSDSYKLEEIYKRTMETLSGVNSVTRGEPSSNLKSGAALALVQSLSQHFNSALQATVTRNDERAGTGVLKLYQRFSPIERLAEIVGTRGKSALRKFTGDELKSVQRVHVEMTNPALRQGSGQLEIANGLMEGGLLKSPEQYFEILESGRLEPLFEDERDEMRLIRGENEDLASGMEVMVSPSDRDNIHMRRHARVLDDPEARKNPAIVAAVQAHQDEHARALMEKAIETMWAIGQDIPPWRMPSPEGPPKPGGDGPAPSPGGGGPAPVERAKPMGAEPMPGEPDMPLMPTNPATGERAPAGPS